MDFYEMDEEDCTKAWKKARDEINKRYHFQLDAVPVLHAVLGDLGAAFEIADVIFDEVERKAAAAMKQIEPMKERK